METVMPVSGLELRKAREKAGLTLKQVSSLYDYVAPATAWQWENEGWKRGIGLEPPADILERIEKYVLDRQNLDGEEEVDDAFPQEPVDNEGVPSFGTWLRQERTAQNLTAEKLAEISGVSVAQVNNIESGRTINPQIFTKNRLAAALNQTIPKDVEEKIEELLSIEGLGSLIDFDPYNDELLPDTSGVYVFYDISQRPVYVGKAKKISDRVKSHSDRFWFKKPLVETASYIKVSDETLRHQLEQVLIKFMKSNAVLNKQSVARGDEDEG